MVSKILHGDSLEVLKTLEDNSIDAVVTDPPYGYSFMGKNWDKAVPSVEIWRECLRVLKPGAFCCVMSAPRSDVQNAMISRLIEAGFRLDFTPIYWAYASGFPKAGNIGKLVDKRLGAEREVLGYHNDNNRKVPKHQNTHAEFEGLVDVPITNPKSPEAKALDGSYAGFQPKPAVEVIIVAMKPLSEKTYVDQALKNGKGITWLDDGRIPTSEVIENHSRSADSAISKGKYGDSKAQDTHQTEGQKSGRFPANLLVSDDVLNDGMVTKSKSANRGRGYGEGIFTNDRNYKGTVRGITDSGSYSRYFDLDKWAQTLPFLIVPKASKSEKNKGLDRYEAKQGGGMIANTGETMDLGGASLKGEPKALEPSKNHHPTVKPLKLVSYLITLTTRKGDKVLDPFVGSGTTVVAAENLERIGIGIEREAEYVEIARARLEDAKKQLKQVSLI